MTSLGYGLAVSTPEETVLAAAAAAEDAGFSSFWLNNPPGANAFPLLGQVQRATKRIRVGTGIVPVSSMSPAEMRKAAGEAGLTRDRFLLGIGSGYGPHPVARVRAALAELRATTDYELVIAALGPRMCALAGEASDGVLLSWLTPEYARISVAQVQDAAKRAGRKAPRTYLYMRIGIGAEAIAKVEAEAEAYSSMGSYAANAARMGRPFVETTIRAESPAEVPERLAAWDGTVDEIVLRALTANERPEEAVEIVEAARPFLP
jgi:alkanesulfonate monooxygenase SsuD/methylene tetrahydromethanopterin reductase-like flavin-dependent oxidoreductase (luciferase family)